MSKTKISALSLKILFSRRRDLLSTATPPMRSTQIHIQQNQCFSSEQRFDFGEVRHPGDAIFLFCASARLHPRRSSVVYFNKLLSAVVEIKQYSFALYLFEEMIQWSDQVDCCTLAAAVDCFCHLKLVDIGFSILVAVALILVTVVLTRSKLIKAFCEAWCPSTSTLLTSHGEMSISLWDIRVLFGFSAEGHLLDEVMPCAKELLSRKIKCIIPNIVTYKRCYSQHNNIYYPHHMVKDKCVILNIVTHTILIDGLCKDKQIERADYVFKELSFKGLHSVAYCCGNILSRRAYRRVKRI